MRVSDFIKHLETYDPETEIVGVIWQTDDVLSQAEAKEVTLIDEEVSQIINALEDNHDACIGINWDTIDYYIDDIASQREGENS